MGMLLPRLETPPELQAPIPPTIRSKADWGLIMGRPRLSPEEREANRKARARFSFSDASYRHYNPEVEGFGDPEQWEGYARKLFGLKKLNTGPVNKWLLALYLDEMPVTFEALRKAFRAAMFKSHPDYGGSNEAARNTMEAYEVLRHKFSGGK